MFYLLQAAFHRAMLDGRIADALAILTEMGDTRGEAYEAILDFQIEVM